MNYFDIVSLPFFGPGIPGGSSVASGIAVTAKEVAEHGIKLRCPALFDPDLTCGLTVICSAPLGASRLIASMREHYGCRLSGEGPGERCRTGALHLWTLDVPSASVDKKRLHELAVHLCATAFDSGRTDLAEVALIAAHPDTLEECAQPLAKLLTRSIIIPAEGATPTAVPRDLASSAQLIAGLRRILSATKTMRFDGGAIGALLEIGLDECPARRHRRVKVAKLAGVLCAGRRAMGQGGELVGRDDVLAASDIVSSGEFSGQLAPQTDHDQEDAFFERMMHAFRAYQGMPIPVSEVQTRVRRSRRAGSKPVAHLLLGLAKRKRLKMLEKARAGGTGGRPRRVIILPPAGPAALPSPMLLALPAPEPKEIPA